MTKFLVGWGVVSGSAGSLILISQVAGVEFVAPISTGSLFVQMLLGIGLGEILRGLGARG